MGNPRKVISMRDALLELISVYSAMDMHRQPMEKADEELDTMVNTDFWIHHASLHLEGVISFLYKLSRDAADTEDLQNFYFTFGIGDKEHSGHFVKFAARYYEEAREMMVERFGTKFAFQYTEEEWYGRGVPQDKLYGYEQIW